MPKPPTPRTRRISNSPKRVPGGSASWSVPAAGAGEGAESGGSVLIEDSPGAAAGVEAELTAGPGQPATLGRGRDGKRREYAFRPLSPLPPMATILQHLPTGQKVGIAFSGGL